MHQEKTNKHATDEGVPEGAVPAYLIDREGVSRAKVRIRRVKDSARSGAACPSDTSATRSPMQAAMPQYPGSMVFEGRSLTLIRPAFSPDYHSL